MGLYRESPFDGVLDNLPVSDSKQLDKFPDPFLFETSTSSGGESLTQSTTEQNGETPPPRLNPIDIGFYNTIVDESGRMISTPSIIDALALRRLYKAPPRSITTDLVYISIETLRKGALPMHDKLPRTYWRMYGQEPPRSISIDSSADEIVADILKYHAALCACKGHGNAWEEVQATYSNSLRELLIVELSNQDKQHDSHFIGSWNIDWGTKAQFSITGTGPNNLQPYKVFTPTQTPILIASETEVLPYKIVNPNYVNETPHSSESSMRYLLDMLSIMYVKYGFSNSSFNSREIVVDANSTKSPIELYPIHLLHPNLVEDDDNPNCNRGSYKFFNTSSYMPSPNEISCAIERLNILICAANHHSERIREVRKLVNERVSKMKSIGAHPEKIKPSFESICPSMRQYLHEQSYEVPN